MLGIRIWTLILFLSVAATGHAQPIHYGTNAAAGRFYPVRGINLYVETYGKGKPLILLHGNGGSLSSMGSIIPYFSQTYQVIAIDSRAHGRSIDPNDSLSFEMMADDVAALLDLMKIDSGNVIGWSDGGIVALVLAMRHPDKVRKLVSTGANLWPDSTAILPSLWLEEKHYYDSLKDQPKQTIAEKKAWKYFMLDWEQPQISLTDIQKIQAPSLIICGDHDLIRIEHTVQIFQNIPRAQLWVLPHSGHGTLIEHTDNFCHIVDHFFSAH